LQDSSTAIHDKPLGPLADTTPRNSLVDYVRSPSLDVGSYGIAS
jgi:hypothetical protein